MGDLGVGGGSSGTSTPTPIPANTIQGNNTGSPAVPGGLTVAQINTMLGTTITAIDALADGTSTIALTDVFPFEHDPTGTKVVQQAPFSALPALLKSIRLLAQSGIPFIVPSSGSMANNGAITLTTALATTYANGYMFLPANAIVTGSTAGWYFCQMSSTTVGTVFNNTYTSGQPTVPASPTAFATTGPGAYTQSPTASDIVAIVVAVAGNTMGVNGGLRYSMVNTNINSAGAKKVTAYFGGTSMGIGSQTTSTAAAWIRSVRNRGIAGAQVAITNTAGDVAAGSGVFLTKDTTASQNAEIRLQIAAATDWVVLESFCIELLPN